MTDETSSPPAPQPAPQSAPQSAPQNTPKQSGNRAPLWLLVGVAVGFGLPLVACGVIAVAFALVAGSFSSPTMATGSNDFRQVHVSGPTSGPTVAIIDVTGQIVSGEGTPLNAQVAAAGDLVPLIEEVAENEDVQAIMLHVNSPGGGVAASDRIYNALQQVDKPIVVWMSDVAASGGYYISVAGDEIIAMPQTITGSIGVIGQSPNAEELLDKIGLEVEIIKSGRFKDMGIPYEPLGPAERDIWQKLVNAAYDDFVGVIVTGRDLDEDAVRNLADGRIYNGEQALDLGLIDALGYREDAITRAAELGAIEDEPRVIRYQRQPSFSELLGISSPSDPTTAELQRLLQQHPTLEYR